MVLKRFITVLFSRQTAKRQLLRIPCQAIPAKTLLLHLVTERDKIPAKGCSGQCFHRFPSGYIFTGILGLMPESAPIIMDGDPARDSLTGKVLGEFEIGDRVGSGGGGEVYRAQDTSLKVAVALKRLPPALRNDAIYRRRFKEEAQRAVQLRHSNRVAHVYRVIEEQNEICLIMEFVEGETLRQRLVRPIQLKEFLHIASQCAEALVAAHGRGIIHGDIKPENIMLTPDGQVKILDFGVAKQMPLAEEVSLMDRDTIDRKGTVSGTPAYMAPEVLREGVDGRADIFSLGIVFYEALTGQHPFQSEGFEARSGFIVGGKPASASSLNSDVSKAIDQVLDRMLAKKPADRYPSALELLNDLDNLCNVITPPRGIKLLPQKDPQPVRKGFLWGALAVLLLAALSQVPAIKERIGQYWGTAPESPSIHLVVLPLSTSSTDTSQKAFCDGLTESLSLWLAHFGDKNRVDVVPPSEVRAEKVLNVEDARKRFGANRVLEGTVNESGNQARVIYSLVDASTGRSVGGDTITVSNTDRLVIEDRVVASVAKLLGLEPKQEDRLAQGTSEPAAYDYYLRGRGYLQDYHKPENVDSAIEVFKHALERDPNYARAYAGLGESYWRKYEQTHASSWVALADTACNRAADLDNGLAIAHNCLGMVSKGIGGYQQAADEFQRAVDRDPNDDDALMGLASAYDKLGKTAEAEKSFRQAIQLHPQYWRGYAILGNFFYNHARYGEAEEQYHQLTSLVPDGEFGHTNLGAAYLAEGRYNEAVNEFKRSVEIRPSTEGYSNLASAYFFQHRFSEAAHVYELAVQRDDAAYGNWGNLAEAYSQISTELAHVRPTYLKAAGLVSDVLRVNPRDTEAIHYASLYQAMLGNREVALSLLGRIPPDSPREPEMWSVAAKIRYRLGMNDLALGELEKSLSAGYPKAWVRDDPAFAGLASNLQFQRMVK